MLNKHKKWRFSIDEGILCTLSLYTYYLYWLNLLYSWDGVGLNLLYSWDGVGLNLLYCWDGVGLNLLYSWDGVGEVDPIDQVQILATLPFPPKNNKIKKTKTKMRIKKVICVILPWVEVSMVDLACPLGGWGL